MSQVTKLPPPNKTAIEYLFKRACATINGHSPIEMSDASNVSRVLGELFANMHEEESKWLAEIKGSKGWVCDLPQKLGGGTFSFTAVNPVLSRLSVTGNSKWSTDGKGPVELKDDADRAELERLMLRFSQEGALLEIPATQQTQDESSASSQQKPTRITMMRDSKDQMRIFQIKESAEAMENLSALLSLVQQIFMKGANPEMVAAGMAP